MRNLKRVLSLGMTAAMISGLMVSAGAAGYTDVTAEDNVEAIEVLQTVGIMVGDEGGNFNPDQNVTRNEMAVVMSNLMDYRVATYAGTSPFTDVPSWAEPYVAACYTNGIVAGTSATTFGGNDTVTAGQAALMLMKALGYFQYQSDFGSDWLLATTQLGTRINLFDGVEAGVREAMTRNDVAQLVLNTLCATMVDAQNNNINVDTGDTSVTLGNTQYFYRVRTGGTESKYDAINDNKTAMGIDNANGRTLELGEELYEGDLKRYEDVRDTYGRPSTQWKYKLDTIGTYNDKALATYNAKVSKGELYDLIGKSNVDKLGGDRSLKVYANGQDTAVAKDNLFDRNNTGAAGNAYSNAVAGKGVQTEVYMNGNGDVTIVYINTYLMRAIDDYNADKGVINVEVLTDPSNMNGTPVSVTQLNDDEFENIKNFKEGDYILYTLGSSAGNDVASVAPAKVVTGKVNSYSQGSYVTLDGTKYEYAAQVEGAKESSGDTYDDSAATEYRVGDTASVVVDNNGYVLYVDSAAISLGNYLFIDKVASSTALSTNYIATAYTTDGTKTEITLNKVYDGTGAEKPLSGYVAATDSFDGWYSYSVNSDGKYTLRQATTNGVASTAEIKGGRADFAVGAGILGNENTVLVVIDGDKDVTAYTGVKNFPDIKKTAGGTFNVSYFLSKDKAGEAYVSVAFVDASSGFNVEDNSTENLVFFLKNTGNYVDTADNEKVYEWDVIMDGEVKNIKVKNWAGATINPGDMYYKVSTDKDGFYDNGTLFSASTKTTYKNGTLDNNKLEVNGSSLNLGGDNSYIVTNDTKIVVVMMPDGGDSGKLANDLMVDAAASWETKTVTGKQLDNMFGDYSYVKGEYYMVKAASDSRVVDTLYLEIEGVY